jgi:hypothetical protein
MGASELRFYNSLWQQAAAEGISVFVASGDSGAAGCQPGASNRGAGAAVNGLCSSPFATCVGGTEFNEGANPAKYWSANNSSIQGSALSYIPEIVWNQSASASHGSQLWSSGGGISRIYSQPAWQQGIAGTSQSNGMRAVPDVALSAAAHDSYIIYENGTWWSISGTSAASPSFAGIMALIANATGNPKQGSANPRALLARRLGPRRVPRNALRQQQRSRRHWIQGRWPRLQPRHRPRLRRRRAAHPCVDSRAAQTRHKIVGGRRSRQAAEKSSSFVLKGHGFIRAESVQ